tara:strand:- start:299 stop:2353 length:2055 start_codon:yes stop_codon:yes gene_type:complete
VAVIDGSLYRQRVMRLISPQDAARSVRSRVGSSGGLDSFLKTMQAAKLAGDFVSPFVERAAKAYEESGDSALQEAAQARVDAARGEAWDKMVQAEADVRRRRGAEYDKMGPEERGLAAWDVESERVADQRLAMGADLPDRAASMASPGYPQMPPGRVDPRLAHWEAESERAADQRLAMGADLPDRAASMAARGYPDMPDIQSLLDERAEWAASDPDSRGPIPPLPRDLPPEIQRMVDRDEASWMSRLDDSIELKSDERFMMGKDPRVHGAGRSMRLGGPVDAVYSPETRKALAQYDFERSAKWNADREESWLSGAAEDAANRRAYMHGDPRAEAAARSPYAAAFDAMPSEAAKVEVADYGGTRAKMLGALKSGDLKSAQDAMRAWERGGHRGVQAKNVWERIAGGHIARHRHDLQNILLKFPDAGTSEFKKLKRKYETKKMRDYMSPEAEAARVADRKSKGVLSASKVMDAKAKGTLKERAEAVKQKRLGVKARTKLHEATAEDIGYKQTTKKEKDVLDKRRMDLNNKMSALRLKYAPAIEKSRKRAAALSARIKRIKIAEGKRKAGAVEESQEEKDLRKRIAARQVKIESARGATEIANEKFVSFEADDTKVKGSFSQQSSALNAREANALAAGAEYRGRVRAEKALILQQANDVAAYNALQKKKKKKKKKKKPAHPDSSEFR